MDHLFGAAVRRQVGATLVKVTFSAPSQYEARARSFCAMASEMSVIAIVVGSGARREGELRGPAARGGR